MRLNLTDDQADIIALDSLERWGEGLQLNSEAFMAIQTILDRVDPIVNGREPTLQDEVDAVQARVDQLLLAMRRLESAFQLAEIEERRQLDHVLAGVYPALSRFNTNLKIMGS